MPRALARLREVHDAARAERARVLNANRAALRLSDPEVLSLCAPLVTDADGKLMTTVIEASWLYPQAVDELSSLPAEPTVAGRLARLLRVVEALVTAARVNCAVLELSADDLVPLLVMALVMARADDFEFEGFVLDELTAEVVAFGKASYCACSLAVALAFLRELRLAQ